MNHFDKLVTGVVKLTLDGAVDAVAFANEALRQYQLYGLG